LSNFWDLTSMENYGKLDMSHSNTITQQQTDSITVCLTLDCADCSRSYISRLTGYKLKCECKCHEKKTLEQQVVGPGCSNVHHIQPNQQPEGSLDG
jgi:hypothetical protein